MEKYSETGNFVVASNFPPRSYDKNENGTMIDFGFYPNAALYLKPKEKSWKLQYLACNKVYFYISTIFMWLC